MSGGPLRDPSHRVDAISSMAEVEVWVRVSVEGLRRVESVRVPRSMEPKLCVVLVLRLGDS